MYRVLFVLSGGLLLAACSSSPDWMSVDAFKGSPMPWNAAPLTESVQFESEPPGATATLSIGQNCKTPCALNVPVDKSFSVTFTLAGYQPASEQVESISDGGSRLRPNPVTAELTPAPPPPKPAKKPAPRKKTSASPKPAMATTAAAPAAAAPAPAPAAASSPWPSAPKQ
jgi:hypothetical protein